MVKREGGNTQAEPSLRGKQKKLHQEVYEAKLKIYEQNEDASSKAEGEAPLTGVRFRKNGTCVAELQDPFSKERVWLGRFETIENANEAVRAKKEEFRERKEVQARMDQTRPVSGYDGPTEREGSSRGLDLNHISIDHNGYLLGVYSTLDDTFNIE